jgi:hypothetical protein
VVEGDRCDNPFAIDGVPYSATGSTSGFGDDYSTGGGGTCGSDGDRGAGAPDVVFTFTAPADGTYTLLKSNTGGPAILYVATDCADLAGSCIGNSGDIYDAGSSWDFNLVGGTTYYLILDGDFGTEVGAYDISLSAPCELSCAGKACGDDGCGGTCGAGCVGAEACIEGPSGTTCCPDGGVGVTSLADDGGAGTLRDAISTVNAGCPSSILIRQEPRSFWRPPRPVLAAHVVHLQFGRSLAELML